MQRTETTLPVQRSDIYAMIEVQMFGDVERVVNLYTSGDRVYCMTSHGVLPGVVVERASAGGYDVTVQTGRQTILLPSVCVARLIPRRR